MRQVRTQGSFKDIYSCEKWDNRKLTVENCTCDPVVNILAAHLSC
jgi:hypothetical protein